MRSTLGEQLARFAHLLQTELFGRVEAETGALSDTARKLIATLEMIPLDRFVPCSRGWNGRPSKDRVAIAAAFVAKAVYGFPDTRSLLERLASDEQLRLICGWKRGGKLPHESTFSRAFAEFALMELPQFVHEALIRETQPSRLVGHIARDSTAIEAREKFPETATQKAERQALQAPVRTEKKKRGPKPGKRLAHKRWKGGKPAYTPPENTRLHRQRGMKLDEMLRELPRGCSIGTKTSSKGHRQYWRGYKLHLDVADGQIPISAVLTAAHVHDSQVAIPLATMTSQRVTYCYELMDSAYDATEIHAHSRSMGHVPIIDPHPHGPKVKKSFLAKPARQLSWAEADRFRERTLVERVNGRLKDEFGARSVRVRGASKVMAHLMFGVLALTVDQLMRLAAHST